jgi:hypothetical protein
MSTTSLRLFVPGVLASALLASCGNVSQTSADQACGDVAQARCSKRMTCTNGVGITRTWGDMTTCRTREKLACMIGLDAPATGNSPALVERCVVAMAGESCADFLDNNPPAECIVTGPRAVGATCAFAGQCATSFCNDNKISACGACAAMPAAGTACTATACARNQACVPSTQLCQDLAAVGAACGADLPCGAGLSCAGATAGVMGTCMASAAAAGMPCGGTMPGCDVSQGLYCGGSVGAKTCMNINHVAAGMPCGLLADGSLQGCGGAGTCYTASGVALAGEKGTCKAPAADNAPCDTVAGPACLPPARCIPGGTGGAAQCTLPAGATCG